MSKKKIDAEQDVIESVEGVEAPIAAKKYEGVVPRIWISARRVDDICYELLEMRDGEINVLSKDARPIVRAQAEYTIQRLCDGSDV